MKTKYLILTALWLVLLCCESKKSVQNNGANFNGKDYLQPDSIYTINSSETKLVDWYSLPTIKPKTWVTKATFEPLPGIQTESNTDYLTTTITIDDSRKKIYHIEKNAQTNSSLKIPKKGYLVQHNDTILAIKKVLAGKPERISVQINSKSNATKEIQYVSIEQGLPQNKINQSLIDEMGYLWFATYGGGVMKFDGNSILNYTEDEGISSNFINYVNKDSKGNIWMGTDGGGITKFDGAYFWHYFYDQGFGDTFAAMEQDSNGDFWLGGAGGLAKLTNLDNPNYEVLTKFENLYGIENERIDYILEDSKNTIWLGTNKGIRSISDQKITIYDIAMTNISGLAEDNSGDLWVSSYSDGFAKFDGTSFIHFYSRESKNNAVGCLLKDSAGKLNIGTEENGLLIYDEGHLQKITKENGLLSNNVYGLTEDNSGNLWCSNFWDGISRIGNSYFDETLFEYHASNTNIYSINQNNDQSIWLGGDRSTVYRYGDGSFTKLKIHDKQENFKVSDIAFESTNNVWFSSHDKHLVSYLQKDKLHHYELTYNDISDLVYYIFIDSQGSPWFAINDVGIVRRLEDKFKILKLSETDLGSSFYKIIEDSDGLYYFFAYETIYVLKDRKLRKFRTVGRYISDLFVDQKNQIWLATNQGLVKVKYNSEKEQLVYNSYSNNIGKTGSFITSLEQTKNGDIWMTINNKGIQVLSPLSDKGAGNLFKSTSINRNDGLTSLGFFDNVSFIDSSENYWVGTKKGVSRLDISSFQFNNNIPKVYLSSLHVNDILYDRKKITNEISSKNFGLSKNAIRDSSKIEIFKGIPKNLELRPGFNHITFGFDAIEWREPASIKFQYKIEGLDTNWSVPTVNNFADYRNIPFGEYSFKLRSAGKSGIWSIEEVYPFKILPPWWHTWWARLGYILLAVFALWIFVKIRVSSVRKRAKKVYRQKLLHQQKLEEGRQIEKDRVAKELHDGVLGSIFGIRLGLDDLDNKGPQQQNIERKKYIQRLSQLEKEIREFSHGLSPELPPSGVAFIGTIEEFMEEQCPINKIQYELNIDRAIDWFGIDDNIKFNLFRIIQESVQNVIRHSEASSIEVQFSKKEDELHLKVFDNGIGFKEGQPESGIGLKNITSRIRSLDGEVLFENLNKKGALVFAKIPIDKAKK